jgi:hypothetical protein
MENPCASGLKTHNILIMRDSLLTSGVTQFHQQMNDVVSLGVWSGISSTCGPQCPCLPALSYESILNVDIKLGTGPRRDVQSVSKTRWINIYNITVSLIIRLHHIHTFPSSSTTMGQDHRWDELHIIDMQPGRLGGPWHRLIHTIGSSVISQRPCLHTDPAI